MMSNITIIGISTIIFYSLTQILKFYSVGEEVYGYYFLFYAFMILSVMILPNSNPTI